MNKPKLIVWSYILLLIAIVSVIVLIVFSGTVFAEKIENSPTEESAETPEGTFQIQIGADRKFMNAENAISSGSTENSLCDDIDIIFILDKSGSMDTMDALLPDGRKVKRLDAVKFATKNFIDLLPIGTGTRVGIVSYHSYGYAKIEQTLTGDFTEAKNSVDSLTTGSSTSIGEGIEKGIEELQINGNANKRIFILLTDGLANSNPSGWSLPSGWTPPAGSWDTAELYTLYEGHLAHALNQINPAIIYTIGVGYQTSINENLLQTLASSNGGKYFFAGTTSIQNMFNEIAANICAGDIEVLILANFQRMKDIGYDSNSVDNLKSKLQNLAANNPNGRGVLEDLDKVLLVKVAYISWNGNEGDIKKTNDLVQAIDTYIEDKKKNTYPNLKYIILVGSHEVLPMKARPDDYYDLGSEQNWAKNDLLQESGYLYDIYSAGKNGYYLTDTIYSDLFYKDNLYDHELTPELAIGRLVETPDQIIKVIDAYMKNNGKMPKNHYVSLASYDLLNGAAKAKEEMVRTGVSTDSTLLKCSYSSNDVPPLLNTKHDLVYFAGHGNYNSIMTEPDLFFDDYIGAKDLFKAGNSSKYGDTNELNSIDGSVIITSSCHVGVNFGNKKYHEPNNGSAYSEFPEEFAKKGVVAFLGITGYGLAERSKCNMNKEKVGYSDKLATGVITRLIAGEDIGTAFKNSANFYEITSRPLTDEEWNVHKRVLAIATLYGIPTYKLETNTQELATNTQQFANAQIYDSSRSIAGYTVQKIEAGTSQSDSEKVIINITDYNVDFTSGLVIISGATQHVSLDEPIVPVLTIDKTLPYGAKVSSVIWNEVSSTSTIVTNDIPISSITNSIKAIEGQFSHDGFYPETPYMDYSVSTLGAGGSIVGIAVNPVQYNSKTNQTKIWTKMVFDVKYEIPETGISVVDLFSDKYQYSPAETMKLNISISNQGYDRVVDLSMIMRNANTNEKVATVNIGQMGLMGSNTTKGSYSIDLMDIPQVNNKTVGELIVSDTNNDDVLGSATVTFTITPSSPPTSTATVQITTNSSDQNSPSISGNSIVWKDKRNGNWDIYMYDISTSTEKRITTNTANQLYPVISGNRIVWEDKRNGNSDIYMYDLSTSTEKQITTNSAHQWYPDISGNRIVWQDKRNGNWDIYMYDLSTSTEKQITTDSKYQTSPSISENRIVWQDYRNGNWDIYMYDLSKNTEKQITKNPANQASPSISENYIVWKDNRNGNSGIYMYDLSTSTEKQITTDSANKRNPAIYGNNIVWQDYRNGGWDIYMYDLSANTEKRLTTNSAIQSNPSISGNNIVWQDYRNGNWDIYMTDLSR